MNIIAATELLDAIENVGETTLCEKLGISSDQLRSVKHGHALFDGKQDEIVRRLAQNVDD